MKDQDKTRAQLIAELEELRARVAVLEDRERERDREKEVLRQNGDRFRAVFDSGSIAIVNAVVDGRVRECNRAFHELVGYSAEELRCKHFAEYTHPDDLAAEERLIAELVGGTKPSYCIEKRYIRKDGHIVWARLHAMTTRDRQGQITGGVCVIEDITGRKRAEEEAAKSKAILTAAIECLPFDFFALDSQGRCILQNALSRKYFGNALGKTAEEAYPDKRALPRWLDGNRQALAGKQVAKETELDVGGQHRHFFSVLAPIEQDGTVYGMLGVNVDITERKRAEEALRESEQRYRTLAEASPDVIYILDKAGRLLYANRTAAAYMRLSPEALVGKTQQDLFPPDKARHHTQRIQRVFETGQAAEMEGLYRFGDQEVWLNVRSIPIRDEQGRVTSVMGVCRNVTEQKRAEQALQQSEERFRKVFEQGPIGIVLLDLDARIQHVNRRFSEMLGYSEQELSLLDIRAITHPDDYEKDRQLGMRVLQGEIPLYTIEKRYVRKDEQVIWGNLTTSLMHDPQGNPTAVIGMVEDITERKLAEEALRSSEATLRALIDASPESILLADSTATILLVNKTAADRLGKAPQQIIGRKPHDVLPPAVADHRLRHFEEVVRTGNPARFDDLRSGRHIENVMQPIFDGQGNVVRVAILGIDHTDRKRAEEALQEAHDELEQRVRERTAELAIFQKFAEASGRGFGMADLKGKIVYVNPTLCRLLGEERPEDALGKPVAAYYPEGYARRLNEQILPALFRNESWHDEQDILSRDGTRIPTLRNCFLIRDDEGKPFRIGVAVTDIRELQRTQQALRQSEERYRAVVEDQTEVISRFSADGRFTFVNDVYCRFFGKTSDELLGTTWQPVPVPEDVPMIEERLRAMSPDDPIVVVENRVCSGQGEVRWMQFVNRGFFDQEGRLAEIQSVGRDITDRKQAEQAIERERQALWKILQASDHERRLISYEIHDGLAQYLASAWMQFQAYEAQRRIAPREAKKSYKTAVELVRQAHFEARRLISEVRPPVIDETGLETALSHLVHEQRRRGGPKIKFDCDVKFGRLPAILENCLYRIAQEALTNACRHSRSKRVAVILAQEGQDIRLEVQDWGIGFEPDSVEKGHFGLEGIRQRVRLLGGRLKIESTPDSGTLLQVVVPIVERKGKE